MDDNAYAGLSAYQAGAGQDAHSFFVDPGMLNPTDHNVGRPTTAFTLQSGWPAIVAGVNVCNAVSGCSTVGAYQPPAK